MGAFHQLGNGGELGAGLAGVLVEQARVAAQLAQLGELGQHGDAPLGQGAVVAFCERLQQPRLVGAVEPALLAFELGVDHALQLFWQVGQHVCLQATQDEGPHLGPQQGRGLFIARQDGGLVALAEAPVRPQHARHEVIEDAPQLAQAVFDGGAGERDAVRGAHGLHGAGGLGGMVLDVLGLVDHLERELPLGDPVDIDAQGVVAGDQHLVAAPGQQLVALALGAGQHGDLQLRAELGELGLPVVDQARRAHDERGCLLQLVRAAQEHGDGLQALAQAHLVCQDAGQPVVCQGAHPGKALLLVGAQHSLQAGGQLVALAAAVLEGLHKAQEALLLLVLARQSVEQEGVVDGRLQLAASDVAGRQAQLLGDKLQAR